MPHRKVIKGKLKTTAGKLRVGVVGIGYLGKFHAEKYAAIPEVNLVGLADILPGRAREWAEKLGTEAFPSHKSFLGKVDAVSVVVPTDQHYQVARDFLRAHCDVLVEKPISSTLEEADGLISLARKHGRILQVGHLERFNPAILTVQEKIQVPLFIESHRLTPFRGRGTEVDVVLDLMIHDLDIIFSFVRSKVKNIHAVGIPVLTDKVDIANTRVEFEGGCVANITASRISFEDRRRIRVFQPDTYLALDYASKEITLYRRIFNAENHKFHIAAEPIEVEPGDALEKEVRAFIHSCMTREVPVVTGEDGRNALSVAMRINEQIQANLKKIPSITSFYGMREDPGKAPSEEEGRKVNPWRRARKRS
ncbi:MAG TPA: Gfo/Idh/MocA family oxidoreductase [Thermodesulfobacteriota bacterium]|nr:Gfo/Idh/MocA family oxidoreductase [Thermodesulfobacteriota bacterium]